MIDLTDYLCPLRKRGDKARRAKRKHTGWTKSWPSHTKSGAPILPEVIHFTYLEVLNFNIEVYLNKNIYPGARAYLPHLGKGTVIYCRLQQPYLFAFLPDSELSCEEEGILQLKHFDPLTLSPNWKFPGKSLKDWEPLQQDEDEVVLRLTNDQRFLLAEMCISASPWQLGEAIRFLLDELKKKVR